VACQSKRMWRVLPCRDKIARIPQEVSARTSEIDALEMRCDRQLTESKAIFSHTANASNEEPPWRGWRLLATERPHCTPNGSCFRPPTRRVHRFSPRPGPYWCRPSANAVRQHRFVSSATVPESGEVGRPRSSQPQELGVSLT